MNATLTWTQWRHNEVDGRGMEQKIASKPGHNSEKVYCPLTETGEVVSQWGEILGPAIEIIPQVLRRLSNMVQASLATGDEFDPSENIAIQEAAHEFQQAVALRRCRKNVIGP